MVMLLDDSTFRSDAVSVLDQFRQMNEAAPTQHEWACKFPAYAEMYVAPFVRKWGVFPPTDQELVEKEPWKEVVFSILTGCWGVIPVFPWTGEQEITKQAAKIRRAIGKIHRDAEGRRRGMIASWIRMHPSSHGLAPRSEIAAAVWRRRRGLRRPSKAQAIQKISEEEETRLIRHYIGLGLSHGEAGRRIYKRARGSEAPAAAMVRTAEARRKKENDEFHKDLESPRQCDETGYYLTMLLREIFLAKPISITEVSRQAAQLRDHLLKTFYRP